MAAGSTCHRCSGMPKLHPEAILSLPERVWWARVCCSVADVSTRSLRMRRLAPWSEPVPRFAGFLISREELLRKVIIPSEQVSRLFRGVRIVHLPFRTKLIASQIFSGPVKSSKISKIALHVGQRSSSLLALTMDSRTSSKLDSCQHPTSRRSESAFGYVARGEDIIIRDSSTGLLLLLSAGGFALAASILACRALPIDSPLLPPLLWLPWLQLSATAAAWLWVRARQRFHVWVRGYRPCQSGVERESMSKEPASKKKPGASLLPTRAPKAKPEPVADKKGFFDLLTRAARSSAKPSARTSGKKTSGD